MSLDVVWVCASRCIGAWFFRCMVLSHCIVHLPTFPVCPYRHLSHRFNITQIPSLRTINVCFCIALNRKAFIELLLHFLTPLCTLCTVFFLLSYCFHYMPAIYQYTGLGIANALARPYVFKFTLLYLGRSIWLKICIPKFFGSGNPVLITVFRKKNAPLGWLQYKFYGIFFFTLPLRL